MTKKHFKAIAEALKDMKPSYTMLDCPEFQQWQRDVVAMERVCSKFNPNFNNLRFLAACGLEEQ